MLYYFCRLPPTLYRTAHPPSPSCDTQSKRGQLSVRFCDGWQAEQRLTWMGAGYINHKLGVEVSDGYSIHHIRVTKAWSRTSDGRECPCVCISVVRPERVDTEQFPYRPLTTGHTTHRSNLPVRLRNSYRHCQTWSLHYHETYDMAAVSKRLTIT